MTDTDRLAALLREYRCQHTVDDGGNGMPLIDVLSPNETVAEAREVVERLQRERNEANAMAHALCGDDEWPNNLHLADVIEKHVFRAGQADGAA